MVVATTLGHFLVMATQSPQPSAGKREQFVTPERSVFGTRLPRPTGVGRHLLIVLVVTGVALAVAVGFAEQFDAKSETPTQGAASAVR
jgi:hypothetical protein